MYVCSLSIGVLKLTTGHAAFDKNHDASVGIKFGLASFDGDNTIQLTDKGDTLEKMEDHFKKYMEVIQTIRGSVSVMFPIQYLSSYIMTCGLLGFLDGMYCF